MSVLVSFLLTKEVIYLRWWGFHHLRGCILPVLFPLPIFLSFSCPVAWDGHGIDSFNQWDIGECLMKDFQSVQFSPQLCLILCNPMDCSMPGLPIHHHLPELAQTHVHWVSDAFQPSHPLSSPSPPAFNLSQHQGLFKWVSSSHMVAKVLEFQLARMVEAISFLKSCLEYIQKYTI